MLNPWHRALLGVFCFWLAIGIVATLTGCARCPQGHLTCNWD